MAADLEVLREIFKDGRSHIVLGQIKKLSLVSDLSQLKVMVSILPEQREVVARMTWEATGPSAGMYMFPEIGDLVLVAFSEGDHNQAYILKRLSSKLDKIPAAASDGSLVIRAISGMKAWFTGTRVNISKGDSQPTENLVLGQQLKTLLANILTQVADLSLKVSAHTHTGNLGYPTSVPTQNADFVALKDNFNAIKASPVNDELILSSFAFTEKGS